MENLTSANSLKINSIAILSVVENLSLNLLQEKLIYILKKIMPDV